MTLDDLPRLSDDERELADDQYSTSVAPPIEPSDRDRDKAADVRAFLASIKPLEGICYCDNRAFHAGRAAVERIALALERQAELPDLAACADALLFLANVQPIDGERCFGHSGADETCGFHVVLDHIRRTILSA